MRVQMRSVNLKRARPTSWRARGIRDQGSGKNFVANFVASFLDLFSTARDRHCSATPTPIRTRTLTRLRLRLRSDDLLHRAPQQGGARSPSAPHSGGAAARLGKVKLRDELPNSGNRPYDAACRARHAEVTDEGGTAAPHLAPHVDVKTLPRIVISKNLQDYGGRVTDPD